MLVFILYIIIFIKNWQRSITLTSGFQGYGEGAVSWVPKGRRIKLLYTSSPVKHRLIMACWCLLILAVWQFNHIDIQLPMFLVTNFGSLDKALFFGLLSRLVTLAELCSPLLAFSRTKTLLKFSQNHKILIPKLKSSSGPRKTV